MKTELTKEERIEIYKDCIEILKVDRSVFICNQLKLVFWVKFCENESLNIEIIFRYLRKNLFNLFPELNLIKPENKGSSIGWFDYGDNESRIKALETMIKGVII